MQAKPTYRYRLTFSKGYQVKYVAHLDMVLSWARTFRRANIPLAYTGGFNPQARIQVAASLPHGYMGSAELMDIYLSTPMDAEEILGRVSNTLAPGFGLSLVKAVPLKDSALQSQLLKANYSVTVETDLPKADLETRIQDLLNAESITQTRIRRKKQETFDLRPLLHTLSLEETPDVPSDVPSNEIVLTMQLSTGQQGNLRPDAVLKTLGLADAWRQVERTKLIFSFDNT